MKQGSYPPRIKMQVLHTGQESTFSIKFTGCANDSNLEYQLLIPAGELNYNNML